MADEQQLPPLPPPSRIPERKWGGRHKDSARDKPKSRRALGLFLLTGVALAIVSAIVAISNYLRPAPPAIFISIPIREYSAFPFPNPFVVQDGERLAEAFTREKGNYEFQEKRQLMEAIAEIRAQKTGPVIVHLCSLAAFHRAPDKAKDGEPKTGVYLLPADAKPGDPKTWIPLADLLDALADCKAPNKLLILDVMRPVADVSVGILGDDVADHVDDELEARNPNFFVLAACSRGQRSHVSRELGGSIFAYFLEKGLRGKADGFGKGNKGDRQIHVRELADYAAIFVNRWVGINRGARQKPRLWGTASDFSVAAIGGTPQEPAKAEEIELVYPKWLEDAWKTRDQLEAETARRDAPRLFRQLENEILRVEKLWRAGADKYKEQIETIIKREVATRADEIRKAADSRSRRPVSITEFPKLESAAIVDLRETIGFLVAIRKKGDEADKSRVAEFAKLTEKLKKHPVETRAVIIVEAAKGVPFNPDRILALNLFLADLEVSRENRFVETVFLERLKEMVDPIRDAGADRAKEWSASLHLAFRLASQAESLLVEFRRDPELLNPWTFEVSRKADDEAPAPTAADSRRKIDWNLALFERAETLRRDAELRLFDEDAEWKGVAEKLREAEKLYQRDLPTHVKILADMKQERDRALIDLSGWQPFLVAVDRSDPREESAWKRWAEAAEQLANLLDRPSPESLDVRPPSLEKCRIHADEWKRAIDERLKRMEDTRKKSEFRDYLDAQALLESPRLAAAQRKMIWTNARSIGKKLHEDAAAAEDELREVVDDDPTARQENDRRKRRVDLFAQLLRLTPMESPAELRDKRDDASSQALGATLRDFAIGKMPKQYVEWVKTDRVKADRLSRVFPGIELDGPAARSDSRNPTAKIRDDRRDALNRWMRDRYNLEAKSLKPPHAEFYRAAAREFD